MSDSTQFATRYPLWCVLHRARMVRMVNVLFNGKRFWVCVKGECRMVDL